MAGKDLIEAAADLRQDFITEHVAQLDAMADELESPLEVAMLWALCVHAFATYASGGYCGAPGVDGRTPSSYVELYLGRTRIEVWPQLEVEASGSRYRLDFGLVGHWLTHAGGRLQPAVFVDLELDGHDFHERTKEQAERDKKRDRDLQSVGWRVARFTGAQVYRDPFAVAAEVIGFVGGLAGDAVEGR